MKKKIFENWNNIAHRGLHDKITPENSIKAFEKAIKNNYAIELDVHILKDNQIVVFHDDNLKRMTNDKSLIKNKTYDEIKRLNLLNTKEKIPLLKDVLRQINGQVPILIELKYDQKLGILENELIKILKNYKGIYYFQSFRLSSIIYMKRKTNHKVGLLIHSSNQKKYNIFFSSLLCKLFKIDFISCPIKKIGNKRYKKCYKKIPTLIWTYKNQKNKEFIMNQCDQIIFEINLVKSDKL